MFDAISAVRKVTEQRNAIKDKLLSEMGMIDERQLSVERRRLLEHKVDEVIARGGLESLQVISEAKSKMADKDYDKDGKIETSKAEVMGSRMRAAKMAGKMKGADKTPPFTPDKKPVVRGTGGPGASAKWLAQQAKRRMMAKEEAEHLDEVSDEKAERVARLRVAKTHSNFKRGLDGRLRLIPGNEKQYNIDHEKQMKSIDAMGPKRWSRAITNKEEVEQMDEGAFKQREVKKQDAERERLRGTWEGGKQPYTPPKGDPRVDKTALRAREYYKKHGKMPPDLA
jgi:hypothetical protein